MRAWQHVHNSFRGIPATTVAVDRRRDVTATIAVARRGEPRKDGRHRDIAASAWWSDASPWLFLALPGSGLAAFNVDTERRLELVLEHDELGPNAVAARKVADGVAHVVSIVGDRVTAHRVAVTSGAAKATETVSGPSLLELLRGEDGRERDVRLTRKEQGPPLAVDRVTMSFAGPDSPLLGVLVRGRCGEDKRAALAVFAVDGALGPRPQLRLLTVSQRGHVADFAWVDTKGTAVVTSAGRTHLSVSELRTTTRRGPGGKSEEAVELAEVERVGATAAPIQRIIPASGWGRHGAAPVVAVLSSDGMLQTFAVDLPQAPPHGRRLEDGSTVERTGAVDPGTVLVPLAATACDPTGSAPIDDAAVVGGQLVTVSDKGVLCFRAITTLEPQAQGGEGATPPTGGAYTEQAQPPKGTDFVTALVAPRDPKCLGVLLGNVAVVLRS